MENKAVHVTPRAPYHPLPLMNFLAPRPREGATGPGLGRQWKVEMEKMVETVS